MNNKKGGVGAKIILVLILMLASAVGGAYGYRVLDGKLAVREAMKAVEDVDISDYDTTEQGVIQGFIDEATKDLETAKTRKEVYEIIAEFMVDVDKVQTSNEKKLEEALRAAEEAKQQQYNNSTNGSTDTTNDTAGTTDSTYTTDGDAAGSETTTDGTYKSNELTNGDSEEKEDSGFLGSLLGGMTSGADSDN